MNYYNTPYLAHYGVKGMKWGVITKDPSAAKKRYDIPEKKSAHRIALEAKYRQKGLSTDEAEQKAAKRIQTEKWVAGVAGTAAVGYAAYSAHRFYGKEFVGVNLKKGSELQYVHAINKDMDKVDINRRLYTTFDKADQKIYEGYFSKYHLKAQGATETFSLKLKATGDIKAPSNHEARKLYKEYVAGVKEGLPKQYHKGIPSFSKMNQDVAGHGSHGNNFMNFLKKRGYNAMLDVNDQYFSGYDAKKPVILFNAQSSVVKTGQSIVKDKGADRQLARMAIKQLGAPFLYGAAAAGGVNELQKVQKTSKARKALKDNPKYKGYTEAELFAAMVPNGKGGFYINEKLLNKL